MIVALEWMGEGEDGCNRCGRGISEEKESVFEDIYK